MSEVLRAGVIGAGVFGGYHAAKYAAFPGATLVGVYDHHREHAEALASRSGGRAFESEADLLAAVDVVSIATPALAHAECALAALECGKSIYVEKPLAVRREDAAHILEAAERQSLVVACGFLERAAFQAMGLFEVPEKPILLESVRLGPPSPRNLDVSVVLDLMIHDLDLALALRPAVVAAVEAEGIVSAHGADAVEAEARFEGGFVARFRASRIAETRERTMRIVYPSGEVRVDFLSHAFENTTPFALNRDFEDAPQSRDRLGASISAFIAAVRGEGRGPLADGHDGARALDLALAVEQALSGG